MVLGVVSAGSFGFGMLTGSSEVVNPGEQAVFVSGGQYQGVVGQGIHPGIPLYQHYQVFDMRQNLVEKTDDNAVKAVTADNINIKVELKIRWDIREDQSLGDIYKNIAKSQSNLKEKVVIPEVEEAPRLCANVRESEDIISTNREEYKKCIEDKLEDSLYSEGLVLRSVKIVNMNYPDSLKEKFEKSRNLEEKREIAEKKLKIARKESQTQVIRAEKRAEAIQKVRGELTDKYIQYYAIDSGLSNANTVYVVPAEGGVPVVNEMRMNGGSNSSSSSNVFNESGGNESEVFGD